MLTNEERQLNMSFRNKCKQSIRKLMQGRNGADELSFTLLIAALIFTLLSSVFPGIVFQLLSMIVYVLCIFRMFSRNTVRRAAENRKYLELRWKWRTGIKQAWVRLKNLRKYKYFKCPECHALLRLPRKVGEVTVTCGKCKHSFKKKA